MAKYYIPVASELWLYQAMEELGEDENEKILGITSLIYFWFFFNIWGWNKVDMASLNAGNNILF